MPGLGAKPEKMGGSLLGTALSFLGTGPIGTALAVVGKIPIIGGIAGKIPVIGGLLSGDLSDIGGLLANISGLLGIGGQSVLGSFVQLPDEYRYSTGIEAHRNGSNAVASRGDAYLVIDKQTGFPVAVWRWKRSEMDPLAGLTSEGYCVWSHYDEEEKRLLIGNPAPVLYSGNKAESLNTKAAEWADNAASLGVPGGSESGFVAELISFFRSMFGGR